MEKVSFLKNVCPLYDPVQLIIFIIIYIIKFLKSTEKVTLLENQTEQMT